MLSALLLLPIPLFTQPVMFIMVILTNIRERQEEYPKHLRMKKDGMEVYSGLLEAFVCTVK